MEARTDRSRSPFIQLLELAQRQHFVVSSRQATELGVGYQTLYRAVAAGKLERDLPHVYRVPGSERTWESQLMAAQLWLDRPDSAVSHRSAAAFWSFPDFERGSVELSTKRWKKPLLPVVVHKLSASPSGDTTTVAFIRVTNPGRTLIDIAGLIETDDLERALEDALRRKLTSVAHLRWLCRARYGKGARGIADLRALLPSDYVPTGSSFEVKLMQALRRAGLPPPVRQHEVRTNGVFVARVDFAYPWAKVAIEADSYEFHSGREAWESDLRRRNALTALGWLVIHATYRQMMSDMESVVARTRGALTPRLGQ